MHKSSITGERQKTRTALSIVANLNRSKNKKSLYNQGKKMANKMLNIFNYQYKDSDLEQYVF